MGLRGLSRRYSDSAGTTIQTYLDERLVGHRIFNTTTQSDRDSHCEKVQSNFRYFIH